MEQSILIGCVVAPALVSLAFVFLASVILRSQHRSTEAAAAVIVSLGWCTSVGTVLLIRQDLDWSALEAWQLVLMPITLGAIGWSVLNVGSVPTREVRWVVAAMACLLTAMVSIPSGEGWADTLPLHRTWVTAIAAASLSNLWMLDRMVHRGASDWVLLVSLAGLAAPAMLAAGAYGGLSEWLLGAIATTLVFAIAVKWVTGISPLWIAAAAALFAASATASGRFYTYDENSSWLYASILLTPSWIAVVDHVVSQLSTAKRMTISATVAMIVLAGIGWYLFGE